jgi:hypothetical protein
MKNALQLESRFSLSPNSLGYCGLKTAGEKFKECIEKGECKGVKKEITNFIVLHPYLRALARITKKSKFSYDAIEAYWLGNNLLKQAKPKDYLLLLKYFKKQGVPDFFVDELKKKVPKVFIPNHLFQVLHVGVGKASGAVPFNIKTINDCMIRWGRVEKIIGEKVVVSLNSLKKIKNKYSLIKIKAKIPFKSWLTESLKVGDIVAVHWNLVIKILTKKEKESLKYWTKKVCSLPFVLEFDIYPIIMI